MSSRLKNKISLSGSSHKKCLKKRSQINPKILDVYGLKKKVQKKNKLKINISERKNHQTSTYQFPQFQINFVQKEQKKDQKQITNIMKGILLNKVPQKIKENDNIKGISYRSKDEVIKKEAIIRNNDENTYKSKKLEKLVQKENIRIELEQQFSNIQKNKENKKSVYLTESKMKEQIVKYISKKEVDEGQKKEIQVKQQRQLQGLFIESVKKIFKILDIFNRGKIAQVNINKWIPEFCLYFLGQIFQKIKQYRLVLNQQEFIDYCKPLYKQSNYEDIKQFISSVEKTQIPLKTSINVPNLNPVQKRAPLEQRVLNQHKRISQKSFEKEKKHQNNLDELLNIINSKEIELNLKIKQIKNKKQSILQQKQVDQSFKKIKNEIMKIRLAQSEITKSIYSQIEPEEMRKSIEFQSRLSRERQQMRLSEQKCQSYQNSNQRRNQNQYQRYSKESQPSYTKQNQLVPNFTFQIPSQDKPYHFKVLQDKKNHQNHYHHQKQMNNTSELIAKRSKGQTSNNLTDRLAEKYNRQKYNKGLKNDHKTYRHYDQSDKIDKLNNKLEEYLKLNEKKIKNSKIFLLENSFDNK